MPTADDVAYRTAYSQLFPLAVGKKVNFTFAQRGTDGNSWRMRREDRVVAQRRMDIAGAERDVFVIESDLENALNTFYFVTWTYYIDSATGIVLGGDIRVIRGSDRAQNWRATDLSVPR
jgi:hypothetical protein